MRTFLTSATLWRFIGGFALGGVGVLALHPASAQIAPQTHVVASIQSIQQVQR